VIEILRMKSRMNNERGLPNFTRNESGQMWLGCDRKQL